MFRLERADLPRRILGCGDGPAAFNGAWTRRGGSIVSADPLYMLTRDQIAARIEEVRPMMEGHLRETRAAYDWNYFGSVANLVSTRMSAMKAFLDDYEQGKRQGRYVCGALPSLPFDDNEFEMALCGHYLFTYSDALSSEQHVDGVRELIRVAGELRIYPLVASDGKLSPHIAPVIEYLREFGATWEETLVDYRFQSMATHMLRIHKR